MVHSPPGIYLRLGKPVRATTALIDNQRFVSLWTATQGVIPGGAWSYKDPQHRHASFSITGVPKANDWAVFPDWFDLAVHWRGYTPTEALDHDWWHTLGEYVVPIREGFGVMEKVVEWRLNRISHLQRYVASLSEILPISSNHIPSPKLEDLSGLTATHASEAGAYHALAKSRFHFVELAGFFCYCREAFAEYFEDGEIDVNLPPSLIWIPWTRQPKTGYIVDFTQHWKTHNVPMWLAHNIPIHYPWSESMMDIPRLSRLDPDFLQAHDEDVLGPQRPQSAAFVYFKVQEEEEYDEWLQMAATPSYNSPLQVFSNEGLLSANVEYSFSDFEDWSPRAIDNVLEASFLSEIFFYEDKVEKLTQKKYRFIYGYRPRKEETLERIGTLLPSSTLNFPYSHREQYKFVYATSPTAEIPTPFKSLLDRLSLTFPEEGEITESGIPRSEGSTSASSRSRSSRRRGEPFVRDGSTNSRERSASPARSGHSGSSHCQQGPSQLRRTIPRNDEIPGKSIATDVSMHTAREYPTLSAEGLAWITSILPSGTDHFPKSLDDVGQWSAAFLQEASFSFQDPRTEWRLRAWHLTNPSWTATRLLNAALSFHMPFRLEIPASATALFARQKSSYNATELASRPFYSAGYRDSNIVFDPNGAVYIQRYLASLANLLMKPNAGAFLFEGGLLSRIAREFAPSDLLRRALNGPSAAITLWNSSYRDNDSDLVREFISPFEEQVLIGESSAAGLQTDSHFIWPDAHTFAKSFAPWQGIWTSSCEEWFLRKMEDIRANRPKAQTTGQWRNELRQYRRAGEITTDTWRHVKNEIERVGGPSWNNMALGSVLNLEAQGNRFSLPYEQ
ncbi:hypothetical protein FIBSPDRAFT_967755 [Athelia psychrophila]|uniref:Uncharacterized protein n=1 Tax=Athelia psychrophila TaxID=1759441 RepID=A0A167VCY9_9AGAM|nr:hypothetical protein FIBSPDRAFT_967755 [Fibularhizoctonia sp. CBS 109695]